MKTERRRELHTNELAQQIDQVSDYVRKNAIHLLLGGGIALVVVLGGYWFIAGQRAKVMDGWASLSDSTLAADPSGAILRYKEVATTSSDAALVLAAWSRIGEVAMGQIVANDKATASTTDWQKTAEEAYTKVAALAGPADAVARGQAEIVLGVLAENKGDFAAARAHYQKVAEADAYKNTPLPQQAKFRLAGLDEWSKPVSFPPAALTVAAPDPGAASSTPASSTPGSTNDQTLIMSKTIDLKSGQAVGTDGKTIPVRVLPGEEAGQTPPTPPAVPTTQPATGG
ncbi:MAG: hypothetical protein HS101_18865 [Planctomycetia bacterium]|jgi:hypothetical protein|nr:hypothetical protein [Planctomycetia bacterium]MCC7315539.1 hypothetical protein [Planctomycetota bacterium]OQZ05263.1 MAG: hypothetical protein B6D36_10965 [Planctomycetes bacterium UTPLA1]